MQDVVLNIKSNQLLPEWEHEEIIELITPGKLYHKNGDVYITYREGSLTGMINTETTLKVGRGRVTLTRTGDVFSEMVFENGFRHLSYYDMGDVGGMAIGVNAKRVDTNFTEKGGLIDVEYAIEVENEYTGDNNFIIEVKHVQ